VVIFAGYVLCCIWNIAAAIFIAPKVTLSFFSSLVWYPFLPGEVPEECGNE